MPYVHSLLQTQQEELDLTLHGFNLALGYYSTIPARKKARAFLIPDATPHPTPTLPPPLPKTAQPARSHHTSTLQTWWSKSHHIYVSGLLVHKSLLNLPLFSLRNQTSP